MIDIPKPTGPNPMPDWLILDFEASSLAAASYPISVGCCDLDLNSAGWLISPQPDWEDWSAQSQNVHGIRRERLFLSGISTQESAERINYMTGEGKVLLCDGGSSDQKWYETLFRASTEVPHVFTLRDFDLRLSTAVNLVRSQDEYARELGLLCEMRETGILRSPHDAEMDALVLAAMARASLDREYLEHLIVADRDYRNHQPSEEDLAKLEIAKEISETIFQSKLSKSAISEATDLDPETLDCILDGKVFDMDIDELNRNWMDILALPSDNRNSVP